MNQKTCPDCGGTLVLDAWEQVHSETNGTYQVESKLIRKCLLKCGYYEDADDGETD